MCFINYYWIYKYACQISRNWIGLIAWYFLSNSVNKNRRYLQEYVNTFLNVCLVSRLVISACWLTPKWLIVFLVMQSGSDSNRFHWKLQMPNWRGKSIRTTTITSNITSISPATNKAYKIEMFRQNIDSFINLNVFCKSSLDLRILSFLIYPAFSPIYFCIGLLSLYLSLSSSLTLYIIYIYTYIYIYYAEWLGSKTRLIGKNRMKKNRNIKKYLIWVSLSFKSLSSWVN